MDRVSIGRVKGLKIAVAAFLLSVALFVGVVAWGLYSQVQHQRDLETFASELHAALVFNCEKNGNPVRAAVRAILLEELRQINAPEIHRFFPYVSHVELEALIAQKVRANRRLLRRIEPVNCSTRFPEVP
jgi:hypothetical protein